MFCSPLIETLPIMNLDIVDATVSSGTPMAQHGNKGDTNKTKR